MILGALVGMLAAPAVFGNTLSINWVDSSTSPGGPFSVVLDNGRQFNTFCIEQNETFSPGQNYSYKVSETIDSGNIGGANTYTPNVGTSIANGTATLYLKYVTGGFANAAIGTLKQLQRAIWFLQGYDGHTSGGGEISTLNDVQAFLGTTVSDIHNDVFQKYNGGQVQALNLYSLDGNTLEQSHLIVVPDGGTTCALLGVALAGLGMARRKMS